MKGIAIYQCLVMPALVMRDLDPDADQLVGHFNWQVHLLVSMFIHPREEIKQRPLTILNLC